VFGNLKAADFAAHRGYLKGYNSYSISLHYGGKDSIGNDVDIID